MKLINKTLLVSSSLKNEFSCHKGVVHQEVGTDLASEGHKGHPVGVIVEAVDPGAGLVADQEEGMVVLEEAGDILVVQALAEVAEVHRALLIVDQEVGMDQELALAVGTAPEDILGPKTEFFKYY